MYKLKCYEIPDGSKASRGFHFANLLQLREGEKISAMFKTKDFDDDKFVTMITKFGLIKRTALSAYRNVNKKGLLAIGLNENDEIAGVRMTDGSNQLIIATKKGMALRLEEKQIRPSGRSAHGVKAISLRAGDEVVSMARVRDGATLLTVTEFGYGKRTALEEYRIQGRGGYGLKNYPIDEVKGNVCGIKVVDEEDDIILISTEGIIIRVPASEIRMCGRVSKGVKVMRVSEANTVVAFTRAEHENSEDSVSDDETVSEDSHSPQPEEFNSDGSEEITI